MKISYVIDNRLAGSSLPGRISGNLADDLQKLGGEHFTSVISLYDQSKTAEMAFQAMNLESRGLRHFSFEIPDFSGPSSQTVQSIIRTLDSELAKADAKVLVHCGAGIGRTGMVLALYLKHHCRISGEEAIAQVREQYDKRAVETQDQEKLVRNSVFMEN